MSDNPPAGSRRRVDGVRDGSFRREPEMSLVYDIEVEISGKEHQGKTNLVAYLSKVLAEAGVELIIQRADSQIDDKLSLTTDQLKAKLAGKKVFLREVQAPF
jgi:hypothetical protein